MENYNESEKLKNLLKQDSIQIAKDILKVHINESPEAMNLSLSIHLDIMKEKNQILKNNNDTFLSMNIDDYIHIVESLGFKKYLEIPIDDKDSSLFDQNRHFIFFNPLGILLSFDTYFGNSINSGKIYFNLKINCKDTEAISKLISLKVCASFLKENSESDETIAICTLDCREALKFSINELSKIGIFLNPWSKMPFLWLLDYSETRNIDIINDQLFDHYKTINQKKIELLPKEVQQCIGKDES